MKMKHMNALLMEMMLAVLIFALASVVILNLFTVGYELSARADALDRAVNHARQISEQLYAADDMPAVLEENGFVRADALWRFTAADYTLEAALESEARSAGTLYRANITVQTAGTDAVTLPCARYIAGEVGA